MLVEGNVEGNVAVGLLGFNLLGIYSSSLMINAGRNSSSCLYQSSSRQSPRLVVARLLVRLAQSLHDAATSITAASCPPTAPFYSPSHVATWTRSLSFREGKGAGCDRWKDGEDHGGQTAAEGPTEAYAEAVWDVEWTACAEDSVRPKKGGWCAIRGRRSTLQVVTLRRLE